jgi:hypothetical protein
MVEPRKQPRSLARDAVVALIAGYVQDVQMIQLEIIHRQYFPFIIITFLLK